MSDGSVGIVYKITHPMINGPYIGQTVKTKEQRWKEHIRDAMGQHARLKGCGALRDVIRAFGPDSFVITALETAPTRADLNRLEARYIKEYDSINKGLNRVNAPTTINARLEAVEVTIDGQKSTFSSLAELCRGMEVGYSSLHYWLKKGLTLEEALEKLFERAKLSSGFTCYRKFYATCMDLSRDHHLNRHRLSGSEIARRIRHGMSPEAAVSTPRKRVPKTIVLEVDGVQREYGNISDAYGSLSMHRVLPPYSTVVSRIEKGESVDEAFGLADRPWWKTKFRAYKDLVEKGYSVVGELSSWSIPVVLHHSKEIFASKRGFAVAHGLEYTTVAERLKQGCMPEEILRRSGHYPTAMQSST